MLLDERERGVRNFLPAAVDRERVAAAGILTISVTPLFFAWRLYDAFAMAHGTMWSLSPSMMSSGPRFGFFVSTFASVHGLKFAVAAWNSGSPGVATEKVSYSSFASSSLTALAKEYRNCS